MKCPICGSDLLSTGVCSSVLCDYIADSTEIKSDNANKARLILEKEDSIILERETTKEKEEQRKEKEGKTKDNDIKADVILKEYWRNNDRFADLFNQVLFEGKQVIHAEDLEEGDTESSLLIQEKELLNSISRSRDIVKRYKNKVDLVLLGIENQMSVHYAMPVRCMLYDAVSYTRECGLLAKEHRKRKELKTTEQFLSGIKKEDKLHLAVTVVIYYGEKEWDGAVTLTDILDIPEEWKPFVNDYKMRLIEMRKDNNLKFKNQENEIFFQIVRETFQKKKIDIEEFKKKYEEIRIEKETLAAISVVLGEKSILKYNQKMKKGEMGMQLCTALQNLREEGREEGRKEGIEEGREKGRKEGIEKGREEGREEGIEKIVEVYLELGMQREFIINKVMEKFDISKGKAEEIANRIIKEN